MKTVKVILSGIVQGVFFRKLIKEKADGLEIKGFVRNLDDGNVEIVAEGEDGKVNELLKICEEGPAHADIKNVEVKDMKHQGFDSFKILSL